MHWHINIYINPNKLNKRQRPKISIKVWHYIVGENFMSNIMIFEH